MTTVAVTAGTTSGRQKIAKSRKPKSSLVVKLQRELAKMTEKGCKVAIAYDAAARSLGQKNDELVQALNERDAARDQRDEAYRLVDANCKEHQRTEHGLRRDLGLIRAANVELVEMNTRNFQSAFWNGNVAAILAYLLVGTNSPADAMAKITKASIQMGTGRDSIEEVEIALKRGYAAQVEQVVSVAIEGDYDTD